MLVLHVLLFSIVGTSIFAREVGDVEENKPQAPVENTRQASVENIHQAADIHVQMPPPYTRHPPVEKTHRAIHGKMPIRGIPAQRPVLVERVH